MKTSYIIIGLLLLVAGYFYLHPELLGAGDDLGTLSLIPSDVHPGNYYDSGLECTTNQDCINYAIAEGETQAFTSKCDVTCYYVVQMVITGDTQ